MDRPTPQHVQAPSSDIYTPMIGTAHHRYGDRPFGIRTPDRLLHHYIIGQTGTGKSTLLEHLALQDARAGQGFCLIDPHGDLATNLSTKINQDHILWSVADPNSPYGYNPITPASALHRPLIASGLIDALRQQWADSWGPRMEHLLRYGLLTLLEQPRADLRDLMGLFRSKDERNLALHHVTDPQVTTFWTKEFKALNYATSADGIAPIANKVGAFLAHPLVRRALCEPEEPLRFRTLMDEGKTLIINLAKGQLGSDTANVLGGLIVSSIMNAAFSRHDQHQDERRPFILYVDEFTSFSTAAFASMLPETRKYGLGLCMAHQHLAQSDRSVLEAIIGNVGTIMAFRTGAFDAPLLVKQLETVTAHDLNTLPNLRAYVQLMVSGQKTRTFSG